MGSSFTEAACQILKKGFMVGETYSNRQRQYTVTEIQGAKLLVRFDDGSIGTLDAKIQSGIITNMIRQLEWLTQDVDAESLDLRRKSMFSAGFLAAVADLQAEVLPQSSATGGEQKQKAIELKRQGLSNEQVSKVMGVSKATIKNYLEGYPYKA